MKFNNLKSAHSGLQGIIKVSPAAVSEKMKGFSLSSFFMKDSSLQPNPGSEKQIIIFTFYSLRLRPSEEHLSIHFYVLL